MSPTHIVQSMRDVPVAARTFCLRPGDFTATVRRAWKGLDPTRVIFRNSFSDPRYALLAISSRGAGEWGRARNRTQALPAVWGGALAGRVKVFRRGCCVCWPLRVPTKR